MELKRLERRSSSRTPNAALPRRRTGHEQAQNPDPDLPHNDLTLLQRDRDESVAIGRPRESGDRSLVTFKHVQSSSSLEVVDDGRTLVGTDCETLGLAVKVNGRVAVRETIESAKCEGRLREERMQTYVLTSSLRITVAAWCTVSRRSVTVGSRDLTTASATRGKLV